MSVILSENPNVKFIINSSVSVFDHFKIIIMQYNYNVLVDRFTLSTLFNYSNENDIDSLKESITENDWLKIQQEIFELV